ncbi:DUF7344 domain-containing protein [Halorubrum salsamenti]|uniref:DUF7344 domain-containing protein n=1 Tax=Halorubrum salsamenti TaxID=2583990 RepID=UPI0011A16848|nr:ArsR family transcriptional regulator [Halorubrum salsamenti]
MREYTSEEIDQRFALLDKYERRCIIHFLREAETDRVSISDVVSHLQKQDSIADEYDKLAVALHHNHFPQLGMIGVVDYDPRSETVRYGDDDLVEALLESIPETYNSST